MANTKKTSNAIGSVVVCKRCGKEIPQSANGLVTEYVWRDGENLCFECNKKEGRK